MNITALRTQLAGRQTSWLLTKRGRGVELGATENNSSQCFERDLNPGPPDFKSGVLTTRPRCLPIPLLPPPDPNENCGDIQKLPVMFNLERYTYGA